MLPAPRDVPRVQRDHRRRTRVERRQRVGLLHARTQRRAIPIAAQRHQPARRRADQVRRRPVRLRPRLPERRHRDVDQPRRMLPQLLVSQPARRHYARRVRLEEKVRLPRQRPQPLVVALILQIQRHAPLARVHLRPIQRAGERAARLADIVRQKRSAPPRRMPARRLHPNHVHPQARQDARGQRADLGGQIQRPIRRERGRPLSCHVCRRVCGRGCRHTRRLTTDRPQPPTRSIAV